MSQQLLQNSLTSSSSSLCRDFQPNQFNTLRCKNCFKLKTNHCESYVENTLKRRQQRTGYLYISRESLDFSSTPSQRSQLWVKRWLVLYDDGALHVSIDQHPDTVAHCVIDLKQCVSSKYVDQQGDECCRMELNVNDENLNIKTFTFRSEFIDELKRWYEIISMFIDESSNTPLETRFPRISSNQKSTLIRIDSPSKNFKVYCSNPSTPNNDSATVKSDNSVIYGTPRSVKNRKNLRNRNDLRSRTCGDFSFDSQDLVDSRFSHRLSINIGTASLDDLSMYSHDIPPNYALNRLEVKSCGQQVLDNPLRKGWLKLRNRQGRDWQKYWVVLSNISMLFYEGVQAEDEGNCSLTIELYQCTNVLPVTVTKNYGIELRLKNSRYTFSAMTPGIRDSWINSIKHVLHTLASKGDLKMQSKEDSFSCQSGKRIAYVAPESHNWFATTTDDSCSTTDDETLSMRSGSNLNDNERVVYGSGENLSAMFKNIDDDSEVIEPRRRSVSPTCRQSPVSRVKDRNSRRKQRRRSGSDLDVENLTSSNDALSSIIVDRTSNSVKDAKHIMNYSNRESTGVVSAVSKQLANDENCANETKKIEVLESQLEMVKRELKQAKDYLQKNNEENRRLLKALSEQVRNTLVNYVKKAEQPNLNYFNRLLERL